MQWGRLRAPQAKGLLRGGCLAPLQGLPASVHLRSAAGEGNDPDRNPTESGRVTPRKHLPPPVRTCFPHPMRLSLGFQIEPLTPTEAAGLGRGGTTRLDLRMSPAGGALIFSSAHWRLGESPAYTQFHRGTGQGPLIHLEQPKVCTPPLASCLLNLLRADLLGDEKSRLGHEARQTLKHSFAELGIPPQVTLGCHPRLPDVFLTPTYSRNSPPGTHSPPPSTTCTLLLHTCPPLHEFSLKHTPPSAILVIPGP